MTTTLKSKLEVDVLPVGSRIDLELYIPKNLNVPKQEIKFVKIADDEITITEGAELFEKGTYEVRHSGDVMISALTRFKDKYEGQGNVRMDTYVHKNGTN